MRLALSTAAAPGATLPQLAEACERRGLEGLFLCGAHLREEVPPGARLVGVEAPGPAPDDVPLVVPADEVDGYARRPLLAAVPSDLRRVEALIARLDEGVGFAWEIRPGAGGDDPGAVLAAMGPRLRLVRLYGGGPETVGQGGMGVGPLMARLALARFSGSLVIGPSRPEFVRAWEGWLKRRAGTGCGSAAGTATLQMGGGW